jgi:hypothetical protein
MSEQTPEQHFHAWSGWPGAFCLKCGAEDLLEHAIGMGYYDPFNDTWQEEHLRHEYTNKPCLISDAQWQEWKRERGIV